MNNFEDNIESNNEVDKSSDKSIQNYLLNDTNDLFLLLKELTTDSLDDIGMNLSKNTHAELDFIRLILETNKITVDDYNNQFNYSIDNIINSDESDYLTYDENTDEYFEYDNNKY